LRRALCGDLGLCDWLDLGVAAIPLRVLGEEGLNEWLVEVGAVLGWALDWEVCEEWCGSHWDFVCDEGVFGLCILCGWRQRDKDGFVLELLR
jgi:hypothetical protein